MNAGGKGQLPFSVRYHIMWPGARELCAPVHTYGDGTMGLMKFNYRSEILGSFVNVTIVFPTDMMTVSGREGRFPYDKKMRFQTIYLLHGGGEDDSTVIRYTNAEAYAQRNCVMLVLPSLPNSFFLDTDYGVKSGTFLTDELPKVVQSLFASSPERNDNFIMGYAMGGSGALAAAIRRPDLYRACIDISGGVPIGLNLDLLKGILSRGESPLRIYEKTFLPPDQLDGSIYDLSYILKKGLADGLEYPDFTLICGSEEGIILDWMKAEYQILKDSGAVAEMKVMEGYGHEMPLWDHSLGAAMDEWLPLTRKPVYPEE